jgi:hypothetical protein
MKNAMILTGSNIGIRKVAISAVFLDVDVEPEAGTTIDILFRMMRIELSTHPITYMKSYYV